MRIAPFNSEDLSSRVRAMNLDTRAAGKHILNEYSQLNGRRRRPAHC
jgi:hypothetical protein